MKVKNWNTLKISKILNISYFITSFPANGPVGYDLHIFSAYNKTICYVTHEDNITVATDQILNGIISNITVPIIILILTTATAVLLFRAKFKRNALSQKIINQDTKDNKEIMTTVMLFTVTILFLITRIFSVVLYEIPTFYPDRSFKTTKNLLIAWSFAVVSVVLNHSVNFAIYIIFFKEFRDTFLGFLYRNNVTNKKKQPVQHVHVNVIDIC